MIITISSHDTDNTCMVTKYNAYNGIMDEFIMYPGNQSYVEISKLETLKISEYGVVCFVEDKE